MSTIVFCLTDEAARLAAQSWLPIASRFAGACGVAIELADVSLAQRILAAFPDYLPAQQRAGNVLEQLARRVRDANAVIVKPPGISASLAQLRAAVAELKGQGYSLPDFPEHPGSPQETALRARFDALRGSVVNAVLRQGTAVRRSPNLFKHRLQVHRDNPVPPSPHADRSCVSSMTHGDFRESEYALTLASDTCLRIEHIDRAGRCVTLGPALAVAQGDVLDAAVMKRHALADFLCAELDLCRRDGLLFSLPLKCTSLRVSDPVIFATAAQLYYAGLLSRHGAALEAHSLDPAQGFSALQRLAQRLPDPAPLLRDIDAIHAHGPALAMVDARAGHTCLYQPGGSSIAVQMAAALRNGGRCTGADGSARATRFVLPNRDESDFYRAVLDNLRQFGGLDPAALGAATLVGLSADAADEYGAQETTFEIESAGLVRVVDARGQILLQHEVAAGDVWRACRRSRRAIAHWIRTARQAARSEAAPLIFWLDPERPRDRETLRQLRAACAEADGEAEDIRVLGIEAATQQMLERLRRGEPVVVATGNLLRDYLGEFLAASETGSSALLDVRTDLLDGGTVFEAGAAGCAPAVAMDFASSNHLRWNPLGDVFAWRSALAQAGANAANPAAQALAAALERAAARLLQQGLIPSRQPAGLDLRHAHVHLARLWAQEMAGHALLGGRFAQLAQSLHESRAQIHYELEQVQRQAAAVEGRYHPDPRRLAALFNPGATFSTLLARFCPDSATAGAVQAAAGYDGDSEK